MQIDVKRRVIRIVLFSPKLLKRADLLRAQDLVAACKALQISGAQIQPHYPQALFDVSYYPDLVQELKRREASINGTLTGSEAALDGDTLTITLKHGGYALLQARRADRVLSGLIREEFSRDVRVRFTGVLEIDGESDHYPRAADP